MKTVIEIEMFLVSFRITYLFISIKNGWMILYLVKANKLGKDSSFYEEKLSLTTSSLGCFFPSDVLLWDLGVFVYSSDHTVKYLPIWCHRNVLQLFYNYLTFPLKIIIDLRAKD